MRGPRVLTPRNTSQASKGEQAIPVVLMTDARRSPSSRLAVTRAPPTTSLWPFRYFVVECTTMSTPMFNGCLLYTSDAADDLTRVDLGGRRIIKKKKKK